MSNWIKICALEEIIPGTGVCALLNGEQVAVFRPRANEEVFAISNSDPFAKSNVLSRGIIAEHKDELWVASPLKKQRFSLRDGRCMEDEAVSVRAYAARVSNGQVELQA